MECRQPEALWSSGSVGLRGTTVLLLKGDLAAHKMLCNLWRLKGTSKELLVLVTGEVQSIKLRATKSRDIK